MDRFSTLRSAASEVVDITLGDWNSEVYRTRSNTFVEDAPPFCSGSSLGQAFAGPSDSAGALDLEILGTTCQACRGKKRKHICGKKLYRGRWAKISQNRDEVEYCGEQPPAKRCPPSPLSACSFPFQESPPPFTAAVSRPPTRTPTQRLVSRSRAPAGKAQSQTSKAAAAATAKMPLGPKVDIDLGDITDVQLGALVSDRRSPARTWLCRTTRVVSHA